MVLSYPISYVLKIEVGQDRSLNLPTLEPYRDLNFLATELLYILESRSQAIILTLSVKAAEWLQGSDFMKTSVGNHFDRTIFYL